MRRALFVCTGNVCRSPMAAAFFERAAARRHEAQAWEIRSAGTWALEGQPASTLAQLTMRERGLDLELHRAHTLSEADLTAADVIIVMTENHRQALAAEFPKFRSRVHLISEVEGRRQDIQDPYGREAQDYRVCADELERLVEVGYSKIKEWASPNPEAS